MSTFAWIVLGVIYLLAYWPAAIWTFMWIYSRSEKLYSDQELYEEAVNDYLKSIYASSLTKEIVADIRNDRIRKIVSVPIFCFLCICVPIEYILWPVKLLYVRIWGLREIDDRYHELASADIVRLTLDELRRMRGL